MRVRALAGATLLLAAAACAPAPSPETASAAARAPMVDARATTETRALFDALHALTGRGVMLGHQDALAYGVRWAVEPGRSDVREAAGSHPAVYGWELGHLEIGRPANLDGVDFARMRGWIVDAYRRGGVVTISWHLNNPVSGGSSWDTTRAVAAILPGGARHDAYLRWLDTFADFATSLRGARGELVPVVFRPYHEMSGSWFWWGGRLTTPEDYKRLWRMTVEHLRDRRGVHNLLYAYAPNSSGDQTALRYLDHYPGDEWVDVMGVDTYVRPQQSPAQQQAALAADLRAVGAAARAHGKIAALTETGFETLPDSLWFTRTLLPALRADSLTRRATWVLLWRNATRATRDNDHFYAPYAGHPSASDFKHFRDDPFVLFEDELPDLYGRAAPRTATPR
ncbi:MAG TPA: glycosyl hydrolase [Gemmatimonadaceae bacterium]|nr:glycosyl hydrolase [Gemmatimonadaceae bacterium]